MDLYASSMSESMVISLVLKWKILQLFLFLIMDQKYSKIFNKTMKKFINIFNRTIDALAAIKKNIIIQFLKIQTELQKETNTLLKKKVIAFLLHTKS